MEADGSVRRTFLRPYFADPCPPYTHFMRLHAFTGWGRLHPSHLGFALILIALSIVIALS
jgi:hypothetical protein